jgi:hypothetical protein
LKKMLENGGYRNEKGNDRMVINRGWFGLNPNNH